MGAMENAGCVTLRDEYLPRSRQDRSFYEFRGLGDPARDGAHVVRRPGDHEVVGRPLAQRVVRRVGLLPRRGRGDRVHRVLDRLHQRPQADRLPPGPAAEHPPDRRRQRRPARGRGELRHDHLRQGRRGAQAAGGLGRAGAVPRRAAAVLPRPRLRQQPFADLLPALENSSGRELERVGRRVAADGRGQHAGAGVRARRRGPLHLVRRAPERRSRLAHAAPPPDRHRPLRRTSSGSLVRRDRVEVDVQGELTEIDELVGRPQPDLLLLNDEDLTYAKIRLDERSLATAVDEPRPARRLAGPRPGAGAPPGT